MRRLILWMVVLVFFSISVTTYAYNWQTHDVKVVNQSQDESKTILTLKDKQERTFQVIYQDEAMVNKFAGRIIRYKNDFFAWKSIKVKEISFMIFSNFLEIAIIPSQITHNNINLATAIPAGIRLTYSLEDNNLRYDYRIMKGNALIRVMGDYISEDEFSTRLRFAYDNPSAYMQMSDTEVLLREIEKIKRALIFLNNEDWLGRLKAIPPETIRKVTELKQNNPAMSEQELWQALKKDNVKITRQELDLILIVYFNNFGSSQGEN